MTAMTDNLIECIRCENMRAPQEFYSRLGKRHKECKECSKAIARDNRRARIEGRVETARPPQTGVYKLCTNCQEDKDTSEFNADSAKKDGLRSHCRSCQSELWEAYSAGRKNDA